jgi:hypothetical protein
MVPLVGVPETIRRGLPPSRDVWDRVEGVEPIRQYGTGLVLRPLWEPGVPRSRWARHAAVGDGGGTAAWEDRCVHTSGHRTRLGGSRRCLSAIFCTTEMIAHGMGHVAA